MGPTFERISHFTAPVGVEPTTHGLTVHRSTTRTLGQLLYYNNIIFKILVVGSLTSSYL